MIVLSILTVLMVVCGSVSLGSALFAVAGGSHVLAAISLAFGVLAFLCGHAIFA